MLILTRRPNDSVVITDSAGERMEVMVLEVSGNQVRMGFCAPDDVIINRREIQDKIDKEGSRCTRDDEI